MMYLISLDHLRNRTILKMKNSSGKAVINAVIIYEM